MIGHGKYDALCVQAMKSAGARGALLILLDGYQGSGFSAALPLDMVEQIPSALREMADQIEADARQLAKS